MTNKKLQGVWAAARISHSDYSRMHTEFRKQHRRHCREIPAWIFNDVAVRRVISAKIAVVARVPKIPETLEELLAADKLAVAWLAGHRAVENKKCAASAQRAGGLAALYVAILYRTYRLGHSSVHVANELQLTPWGVRQTLWRLKETKSRLDSGRFRFSQVSGVRGTYKHKFDHARAIKMRARGLTFQEIAEQLEISAGAAHYAVKKSRAA